MRHNMELWKSFGIDDKLYAEFLQFCALNNIQDSNKEFIRMFTVGFNIAKYGTSPFKTVEKETKPKRTKKEVSKSSETSNTEEIKEETVTEEIKKPKKQVRIIKNS